METIIQVITQKFSKMSKTKIYTSLLIVILIIYSNNVYSQKSSETDKTWKTNLDFGLKSSLKYTIAGPQLGITLKKIESRFSFGFRYSMLNPMDIEKGVFHEPWYMGAVKLNYCILNHKNNPLKISVGFGRLAQYPYLYTKPSPYIDLGNMLIVSLQKEIKNFEIEFEFERHIMSIIPLDNTYHLLLFKNNFNLTLGLIYKFDLF
jgi:hypothetical protein